MTEWQKAEINRQWDNQRKFLENHLAGKYNSRETVEVSNVPPSSISPPEHRKIRSLESYRRDKARQAQAREHAGKWALEYYPGILPDGKGGDAA